MGSKRRDQGLRRLSPLALIPAFLLENKEKRLADFSCQPSVNFRFNLLASAAESPAVEPTARAFNRTACHKAATASYRTTTDKAARSRKTASIGPAIIWMSPAVVPGACADKDPAREPARTIVAVGCASVRIVRVIAVRADRRATHHDRADADSHSDPDLRLRIR